jgi:hypothetical protein
LGEARLAMVRTGAAVSVTVPSIRDHEVVAIEV